MQIADNEVREDGLTRRGLIALIGYGSVAVVGGALAPPAAAEECKDLKGTQRDSLYSDGCTSPVGFCARGTFKGNHGFEGQSAFSARAFDPIPDDPLGRLAVPGTSSYTTVEGTILVDDVSAFDVERGTYAGIGRIVDGTAVYEGATGDVFTYGHVGADGSSFTTKFVIELCLPG